MLRDSKADSVTIVVKYDFPPQRGMVLREGCLAWQFPEFAETRSQDLEPIYHDCGQFDFCSVSAFEQYGTTMPPKILPLIVPDAEAQDIDNPSDWAMAEIKYRMFISREAL